MQTQETAFTSKKNVFRKESLYIVGSNVFHFRTLIEEGTADQKALQAQIDEYSNIQVRKSLIPLLALHFQRNLLKHAMTKRSLCSCIIWCSSRSDCIESGGRLVQKLRVISDNIFSSMAVVILFIMFILSLAFHFHLELFFAMLIPFAAIFFVVGIINTWMLCAFM